MKRPVNNSHIAQCCEMIKTQKPNRRARKGSVEYGSKNGQCASLDCFSSNLVTSTMFANIAMCQ
eukprot:6134230-Amphidinium_carterae.1